MQTSELLTDMQTKYVHLRCGKGTDLIVIVI